MRILMAFWATICGAAVSAAGLETESGTVTVERVASGFTTPWAIGLLPDGSFLVTERGGTLRLVQDGRASSVSGVPEVAARGQGGLLDVTVARDFATSREIWLTYSKPQTQGAGTALLAARLSDDGTRLEDQRLLFEAAPVGRTGRHFGSRVVEATDGTLFVTIGDRGDRPSAQDRSNHNGAVIRINRDGSVPADNPFVGQNGIQPEIWSFGHRNPQGAGLDGQGNLWTAEHGARGGDEVNRIKKGANFGWPVISYGRHYSGQKIGEGTTKAGMEQPRHYWDPSIAPSGLLVYGGGMFPEWQGDIFVGSLKFGQIVRLNPDPTQQAEVLSSRDTRRVRDLAEAADGSIWFLSEGNGAVYRITR